MKSIQSRENPFYKELAKLSGSARQRNQSGQTLLDGAHLLTAYLDSGNQPQHILLNSAALRDDEITGLLQRVKDIPVTQLDDKLFAGLSDLKSPSGILALIEISRPDIPVAQSRFALLLEDIQDPGNLGSMLRSAAAAGCDAVFLSRACADAWSPKVLRAAMGGHFSLRIYEQQDLPGVAKAFCEQPLRGLSAHPSAGQLLAASLHARHSLYDCDLRGKVAFMVGNEGAGLSDGLLRLATQEITIPMHNNVESLNAAAATAICLFEAVRQRHAG
jgi:TrmH family RNA methyltransferase